MSTVPFVCYVSSVATLAGSISIGWNHFNDSWDSTAPYWNTDLTAPESWLIMFGGFVLAIGFAWQGNKLKYEIEKDPSASVKDEFLFPKLPNYCFAIASLFIAAGAGLALADTFNQAVGMDFSSSEISGARTLQGIVGVISLVSLVWNIYQIIKKKSDDVSTATKSTSITSTTTSSSTSSSLTSTSTSSSATKEPQKLNYEPTLF